jgi:hypothetical protein
MRKVGQFLVAAVALAGGATAASVGGCSRPEPAAPATVRGTVTFQGRPLAGGLVVFAPDREKGNPGRPVSATVAADGTYRLTVDGTTAVAPGWYRVAIADPPEWYVQETGLPRFPPALRRPDRAGLNRQVVPGQENVFDFLIEVPGVGH